jgi:hypothetical protein
MSANRGVAYVKPGTVEVRSIDYPKLRMPASGRTFRRQGCPHGVILGVVTTNTGSDQHMVWEGLPPAGLILGHEITAKLSRRALMSRCSRWASGFGAVQHRMRSVPELPRRGDGICLT